MKNVLGQFQAELKRLQVAMALAFAESNPKRPEDCVVFPMCCASGQMAAEIVWMVNENYGAAALRTARTLYECVVFAFYINKHPETAD